MVAITQDWGTIEERNTGKLPATLRDEAQLPITLSSLSTLTLTLVEKSTGTVINGRNAQNVFGGGSGQNNVTLVGTVLTWIMQPLDNIMVTEATDGETEVHLALFEYTYPTGLGGNAQFAYRVRSLVNVP